MRTVLLTVPLLLISLCAMTASATATPTPLPTRAETSPVPQRPGDEAFLNRQDEAQARAALAAYREGYRKDPSAEAGWRLAMADYFVGLRLTPDHDEQVRLFGEGRDAGRIAADAAPQCAPCQFWTAIDMALYGERVGALKMFFSLSEIQDRLRKTVAIEPGYASGGAYRLLGLIRQRLPGILGGSNAQAQEFFEQAIQTAPDEPLNYLFLARLFKDELDQPGAALVATDKGLAVPKPAPNRLESIEALRDLAALRATLLPAKTSQSVKPDSTSKSN